MVGEIEHDLGPIALDFSITKHVLFMMIAAVLTILMMLYAAAKAFLPADKVTVHVHADRGHTLGDDVVLGPIDEAIAERIAEEAAAVASSCPR